MNPATLIHTPLQASGLTNVGNVRKNNEDSWVSDPGHGIFLVADGIGGHAGGEVASSLSTMTAYRTLRQDTTTTPAERLRGSFKAANREVLRIAQNDRALHGMGTTLVALLLSNEMAWIAHCGDSRCYLLRKQALMRLTVDHSGYHGELMHAVGLDDEPVFTTMRVMSTHPGDLFMLCSDGLTNAIPEQQIAYRMRKRKTVDMICRDLVQDALEAGGPDNVTVVVVKT